MYIVYKWYLFEKAVEKAVEKVAEKLARKIGLLIAVDFISEFSRAFKCYDFSFSQD